MKKEITPIFSSPINRIIAYMLTFIFGAALFEFLRFVFNYARTITPGLILIALFVIVGYLIVHQRTPLSRITSASILFALSFISISLSGYPIPSAYLLLIALLISFLGSSSFLHAKYSPLRTLLLAICISATALLFVYVFMRVRIFM